MELRDYIRVLRTSWLIIVLATVAGLIAAGAYTALQTTSYRSTAKIVVSASVPTTDSEQTPKNDPALNRVRTYAELISTPDVLEPVIETLGLDVTVQELAGRVQASVPGGTAQIVIAGGDSDPQGAADLANALVISLTETIEKIENREGQPESIWVTTVQDAVASSAPSSPKVPTNLLLGGISGLALGLMIAVLRDVFGKRASSKQAK